MSHATFPLTAIDVETTGVAITEARIVQIAMIGADENAVERDSWSALIRPLVSELPPGFAARRPAGVLVSSFAQIADEVLSRLAATTLIAHNAAFDVHFLARELARTGRAWRPDRVRCTLMLARGRLPGLSSYRLSDLARYLALPTATHEAVADARCALALYRVLTIGDGTAEAGLV